MCVLRLRQPVPDKTNALSNDWKLRIYVYMCVGTRKEGEVLKNRVTVRLGLDTNGNAVHGVWVDAWRDDELAAI